MQRNVHSKNYLAVILVSRLVMYMVVGCHEVCGYQMTVTEAHAHQWLVHRHTRKHLPDNSQTK